jgi:hypothetical protein
MSRQADTGDEAWGLWTVGIRTETFAQSCARVRRDEEGAGHRVPEEELP